MKKLSFVLLFLVDIALLIIALMIKFNLGKIISGGGKSASKTPKATKSKNSMQNKYCYDCTHLDLVNRKDLGKYYCTKRNICIYSGNPACSSFSIQ